MARETPVSLARARLVAAWAALRGQTLSIETETEGRAPERVVAEQRAVAAIPVDLPATGSARPGGAAAGSAPRTTSVSAPPPLLPGRQTQPVNYSPWGLSGFNFIWRREYQDLDLSSIDVGDYEAGQLLTVLADLSPDVSRAVWNVLRVAGTALSFHVTTPAGDDDALGQALLDGVTARLNRAAGGLGALIVQLLQTAYLQGAVALDVAPTPALDGVEDLYPVNPVTIYYQRDGDQNLVPFQRQQLVWGTGVAPFRRLNTELFAYTPIDPFVDDPYGRSPCAPVLQIVFFQAQVLRDLERVIHAQGWPKVDLSVVTEILQRNMPPDVAADPAAATAFVRDRLNDIQAAYAAMNPDDAYVHLDYVQVSSAAAAGGANLFDVAKLMQVIRAQIISAVKQLPVLMGEHLGDTETYSTVELAIFAASIDAFRQPVGAILAWALTVALRLMGHLAVVTPEWTSIQVLDRMREALARAQEAANAAFLRDQGWITQDEASTEITGSAAVSATWPVGSAGTDPGNPGQAKAPSVP